MSMTKINWYPGHMHKTKNLISENLKVVDLVLEVVDSRIPMSSKNPNIVKLAKEKKRVIILNKSDLVEKKEIEIWKNYFIKNNYADEVLAVSAESGDNFQKLYKILDEILKLKREKYLKKGIQNAAIRIMVVGIPNVGKSRVINRIVGKRAAGVGNMPGFTRGKQWIRIRDGIELLDMPGILWPKFDSDEVGHNLAMTGSIKDDILNLEEIASVFIDFIRKNGKTAPFMERYKLTEEEMQDEPQYIIEKVAKKLGLIQKNEVYNIKGAALQILKDYRAKKLGKFGLDSPGK
jgi:ribosome biogenesis GTPase A